ncbi:MAG: YihA family ribosome biogenesis GTP-binding protein [Hyphomicrobiales bacterium]|nr:MAG: YihA family ribosome biogenesis GTP-binding protein [Hyphomicrobiales bacterium]
MQSDDHAGPADPPNEPDEAERIEAERIEAGRKLFAGPCDFILSAVRLSALPGGEAPEVAFAGRSNVGKSSLINALTGRKTLARTSNTPGRTRELNVFDLGGAVTLIDMPGYGYARASKKLIAGWTGLVRDYLRGRARLRRVFLLIDARHGIKANDLEVIELMDQSAVSYQAVLTKIDKIKASEREKVLSDTAAKLSRHPAAHPVILTSSARKGEGVAELRAEIASLALERH